MMYELLYIIPARYTDAEIEKIQEAISSLIEKTQAKVVKGENLGRIRLAYPIKQTRHGTYILLYFEAAASVVAEIERQLRLAPEVLRHLLIQSPAGLPERAFSLESYVAPLSEEEEESRRPRRPLEAAPARPVIFKEKENEALPREGKPFSMEELDKQLDEILEADISKEI